jgi:nucleoside-diphosphate-sugar epimerase
MKRSLQTMKKALVVGASGGMGVALTRELSKRNITVVAFARNKEKLKRIHGQQPLVQIISGDACSMEDLSEAAKGVDVIFHAANVPYPEWSNQLPLIMTNVLETAERSQAKLVIIDNIYAYGKNPGHPVAESHPKQPCTKKGMIRLQLEQKVKQAQQKGLPALITHFPDFYGPLAENTSLHVLLAPLAKNKKGVYLGELHIPREYVYLPDAAKAVVQLALTPDAYGESWNIPGPGVITGFEILQIAEQVLNRKAKVQIVGPLKLFLAGLFQPTIKEVREMYYLYAEPVFLDGTKYETRIGSIPKTPYVQGIEETLRSLM